MKRYIKCYDSELDDNFLVEGYYDNQGRGLAESAETSDLYALNEIINDYANRGYYIVVYNLTDGVVTEFNSSSWLEDSNFDSTLFYGW